MVTRRDFLSAVGLPSVSCALGSFTLDFGRAAEVLRGLAGSAPGANDVADDEDFWRQISLAFAIDRSIVNLNNGGVSPSPRVVQQAVQQHEDYTNTVPAHALWTVLEPQREGVRKKFARCFGCDTEEVAFTRNASESLETCQFGLVLQPGDEILTTNQDYPRMIATFKRRKRREGVVLRQFSIPVPCEDPTAIVARFEENITPRTRLILACHVINITGQILPVQQIVALARKRGIPVIVDGAHALANLDFQIRQLDCDYYGSSLHKWLFAPIGTGMLYVRQEKIGTLWPLMGAGDEMSGNIRKFEEIGTHPAAPYLAIADAINFHEAIGAGRKQKRLLHLRDYWGRHLARHERVRMHTSLKPGVACGVATMQIDGVDSTALAEWLWRAERILVTPIVHAEFQGIRVSPSVYTTFSELDRFGDAIEKIFRDGLPS